MPGPSPGGATASEVRRHLGLEPHPAGGWWRETFRDSRTDDAGRPASSAALHLLDVGETAEWHRLLDAAEIWHWHAGSPLVITVSPNGHDASAHHLGPDLAAGQHPQFVVPAGCWRTATSLGAWTLAGRTMAPAFTVEAFELAPPDWRPRPRGAPGPSHPPARGGGPSH